MWGFGFSNIADEIALAADAAWGGRCLGQAVLT
jgi:hypothetical protein